MARADLSSTTSRSPSARLARTFSTVEAAHASLIERLAVLSPCRILYIADAQNLGERAEHLQQVLGAVLDYVAIVADTGHANGGSIDQGRLLDLISDAAGDVAVSRLRQALGSSWTPRGGRSQRCRAGSNSGHCLHGGHPRWDGGGDRGGLRGQVHALVVFGGVCGRPNYFRGFFWVRSRSLTPGPPPFSSMNSTPAFSRTRLMFESVSGSPAYRPTSRLVTVLRCKPVASARSRTVQFNAARAIRTCALVTVI